MRNVVLTNEQGTAIGIAEIVDAHTGQGKLHKAFSVFVFNPDKTKLLLQQRSAEKMLFALKWANTCCSHPYENESIADAGERRLKEELGIDCDLDVHSSFVYRAEDPEGKGAEYEHDTILIGHIDEAATIKPDPNEIADHAWMAIGEIYNDLRQNPGEYAPWFLTSLNMILERDDV